MQPVAKDYTNLQVTIQDQPLPNVEKKENETIINCPLTIPESALLLFVKNGVKQALDEKRTVFFLGTSPKMQSDFTSFTTKAFSPMSFQTEELNLATIVSSIWLKTKTFLDNHLKTANDLQGIEDEKEQQKCANSVTEAFNLQGISGKAFTVRQASFLVRAVGKLENPDNKV